MTKTKPTKYSDIKREWHLVDVKGKILGRIASDIAQKLIGKDKPYFVPNLDCGDFVVVVNAKEIEVSGNKAKDKTYMRYSGYPAGLKIKNFSEVLLENPSRIIEEAVAGMLPKNKLRDLMLKRLFVFKDDKHTFSSKFNK